MTRQKKSRSSGSNGQRHLSTEEIRKTRQPKEETKKKGAGLKSGSRNSPLQTQEPTGKTDKAAKDKRIGSKKAVALVPEVAQPATLSAPKASLVKAKPLALTPEQELAQIEADVYLQQLLERVEKDEILTGKDAKYFNAKTARLEVLLKQLGLDEDTSTDHDPLAEFEKTDWRKSLLGDDD